MSQLFFGYCEAVINPSHKITLAGYEHRYEQGEGHSGILDDLNARVLNLKSKDNELFLITLDLCMLDLGIADDFREAIALKFNLPKHNIMLSCAHTHSGPVTSASWLGENISEEMKQAISLYIEEIKGRILTICSEARYRRHHCKVSAATLKTRLGYNRRGYINDEQGKPANKMFFNLWMHPGEDINMDIDQDIPVLMLERLYDEYEDNYLEPYGQKRIVLFSVPYHPVVFGMNNRFASADYVGAARECIEEALGFETKAMFLLGACGDINVMMACQENPRAVQIVGRAIGYSVVTALSVRRSVEVEKISAVEEALTLDSSLKNEETGQENLSENDCGSTCSGNKPIKRIIIQTFRIGNAAIAAVSAECFSELGIKVRKASGFSQTLVATNTNGTVGYLPSKKAFGEGGYEVENAKKTGLPEDILDRVIEILLKNLAV